jgi:hypothetical protein
LGARNYYYFVATLPFIEYGDKPPVSSEEFREQCNGLLHPDDAALIRYCYYNPPVAVEALQPTGSDFIDLLMARERTLLLNLAYLRAGKLKRPSPEDPPHDVPRAEAVAKTAFDMADPLEAAIFIDKSRWGALNDMVGIDLFGVNNIFAYLMKLQLLERRQCFDAEIGTVKYKELYDSILNAYNSRV